MNHFLYHIFRRKSLSSSAICWLFAATMLYKGAGGGTIGVKSFFVADIYRQLLQVCDGSFACPWSPGTECDIQ